MAVGLAINPITWVNDDLPSLGAGTPLDKILSETRQAGFAGTTITFVNYVDELPFFCSEVLPRLAAKGLRQKSA